MNIIYFFTYGYSLKTWEESSALDREVKYFNYLSDKYGISFTIITYGDEVDLGYSGMFKNADIIPIYSLFNSSKYKLFNLFKSFLIPFKLKKIIKEKNFIIKQNQLLGSWVSCIFKLITRNKLFVRTGYDMYFFSLKDKKSLFKRFLYRLLTYLTLKFSDLYTVSSQSDYDFLQNKFVKKNKNIAILSNWIETTQSKTINTREKSFISVGRLEYQKNIKFLIREFINNNHILQIYGSGSEEEKLRKLIGNSNERITIFPTISNYELIKKFCNTKYFVISSHFEGNPKVLLEAMSAGCIVFASNISNHREIIEHGKNGFLFDLNQNALNNLIKSKEAILKDKTKADTISQNAINKMETHYSLSKITDKEQGLLLELLNG